MADPIARARQDIELLDAEIHKLQAERDKIAAFIDMYGRYAASEVLPTHMLYAERPLAKKDRIFNVVSRELKDKQRKLPITELLPVVLKTGIVLGAADPAQQLAQYLSRDERLKYDRAARGWSLTEAKKFEGPDLAGSSPSIQ